MTCEDRWTRIGRIVVEDHERKYGPVSHRERLEEAITTALRAAANYGLPDNAAAVGNGISVHLAPQSE